MAMLEVRGLTVTMGSRPLLRELDMSLESGSLYLLTGANGSGKTTLLDAIAGCTPYHRGSVAYDGVGIDDLQPFQRARLGLLRTFQTPNLFQGSTVAHHLLLARYSNHPSLPLYFKRFPSRPFASSTSSILALEPLLKRRVDQLSFGEMKLVNTARTVEVINHQHNGAGVLLLDEPLASLHDEKRIRVIDLLEKLRESGSAVLVVEHSPGELLPCIDTCFHLADGFLETTHPNAD